MLLYVHRNRRLIRDGSPGRGHLDFHTAPELCFRNDDELTSTETIRLVRTATPTFTQLLSFAWKWVREEANVRFRSERRQPSVKTGQAQVQPARKETLNIRLSRPMHAQRTLWDIPFVEYSFQHPEDSPRGWSTGHVVRILCCGIFYEWFANSEAQNSRTLAMRWMR